MAYLTIEQLNTLGLKSLGENVKISDKACIYEPEKISIGDSSRVDDFCIVSGNVIIGKNVHIAPFCLLAGGTEGIEMLDFSGCAYNVQIFSQSDDFSGKTLTNPTIPSKFKNEKKARVKIGKHVIIGTGSLVFPGVNIAEGCSVGALALVNKSTKPWGIYTGNPAKRIKDRSKDLLSLEIEFLNESNSI